MSRVAAMMTALRSLPDKAPAIGEEPAGPSGDAFNSVLSGFDGKGGAGSKPPATDEESGTHTSSPDLPGAGPTSQNPVTSTASSPPATAATLIQLFANVSKAAPSASIAAPLQKPEAAQPVQPVPEPVSQSAGWTPPPVEPVSSATTIAVAPQEPTKAVENAPPNLIALLQTALRADMQSDGAQKVTTPASSIVSSPAVKTGSTKATVAQPDGAREAPTPTPSLDQNTVAVLALASIVAGLPPSPSLSSRPAPVAVSKGGISAIDPGASGPTKNPAPQGAETAPSEPSVVMPSNRLADLNMASGGDAKSQSGFSSGASEKTAPTVETVVMNVSNVDTATHFLPVGFAAPMQQIADAIATTTMSDSPAQASSVTTGSGAATVVDAPKSVGPLKTLTIGLEPENLGSVSISMRVSGNRLDVEIEASRPETTRLIGKDKDVLSQTLQSSGYSLDSLVVKSAASSGTDSGGSSAGGQQQSSFGDGNAQSSFGQSRDSEGRRPPPQFAGTFSGGAAGGGGAQSASGDGRDGVYL